MLHIFHLAAFKVVFRGYSTERVQGYKYNHTTKLTSIYSSLPVNFYGPKTSLSTVAMHAAHNKEVHWY